MNSLTNQQKGKLAEGKFKEWLDKNNIPHWYIQQDIETMSPALRRYFDGRRPDYMILLPHLGFILVDVEYKNVTNKYSDFAVDSKETLEYSNLQRNFNLEVWYAYSNEHSDFKTWFWIPVSKALEKGKGHQHTSSKSGEPYFSLKIEEFIQISNDDSLGPLFSKLLLGEFKK